MSSDRRVPVAALGLAWLVGCAGAAPAVRPAADPSDPDQLYPLAEGNAWSYDVDSGDGDTVLAVARVASVRGAAVEVLSGGGEVLRYERRPDGIYRPHRRGFLLQGPVGVGRSWESLGGVSARVERALPAFETPAGVFEGCLEVVEQGLPGGQRVETTYCPGVGPVQVVSTMRVRDQDLRVVARLRGYQVVVPDPLTK